MALLGVAAPAAVVATVVIGAGASALLARGLDRPRHEVDGRFDRADFIYLAGDDAYVCPAGARLTYRFTNT